MRFTPQSRPNRRWLWLVAALILAPFLFRGCVLVMRPVIFGRTDNINPGESAYPAVNPHPTRVIRLVLTIPPSLSLATRVTYSAGGDGSGGSGKGGPCVRALGRGITAPFTVTEAIALQRTGDIYSGTFVIDKYLPGQCGWHFQDVGYQLTNGRDSLVSSYDHDDGAIALLRDPTHPPVHPNSGAGEAWCWTSSQPVQDARRDRRCFGLRALRMQFDVDPRQAVSTSTEGVTDNDGATDDDVVWITPETATVEFRFHDLDAIPGVANTP